MIGALPSARMPLRCESCRNVFAPEAGLVDTTLPPGLPITLDVAIPQGARLGVRCTFCNHVTGEPERFDAPVIRPGAQGFWNYDAVPTCRA